MTKLYLFDIEGTTTDINFVHKILFPYSEKHLAEFIRQHPKDAQVQAAVESVKKTVLDENHKALDQEGVIQTLSNWIRDDRKHGALKELQGLVWAKGYSENHFQGHVYPDVKPAFEKLKSLGASLGIYSSGSVQAQKLIFGFSEEGDLTPYLSYYFDTRVGAKREVAAYEKIAAETNLSPADIHFFSDIPEELVAAQSSGMQVTHVVREGTKPSTFPMIRSFQEIL